ncbi:MAG: ImmA/IrrE family metallo-endopeptidase [Planctomycetota bacterium]
MNNRRQLQLLQDSNQILEKIAICCLELARFSISIFDDGFKSARGDSEVAIGSALSGAFSAVAIGYLNLKSSEGAAISLSTLNKFGNLEKEARDLDDALHHRISILREHAEKSNASSLINLEDIIAEASIETKYSDDEIQKIARILQSKIWDRRSEFLKEVNDPHQLHVLEPARVFTNAGYEFIKADDLGYVSEYNTSFKVAGELDRKNKRVSISERFSLPVQKFTAAHELGHAILHRHQVQFRDRPLQGEHDNQNRGRAEYEADRFAVYFLMPEKLVKAAMLEGFGVSEFRLNDESAFKLGFTDLAKAYQQLNTKRDLSRVLAATTQFAQKPRKSLAELFGVSKLTMAIRLEELELVELSN